MLIRLTKYLKIIKLMNYQMLVFLSLNYNKCYFYNKTGFYSITELSEEWALATSLKDLSENQYDEDTDDTEAETFSLKYLGNTVIESARSEEATADAVKAIISTAKGMGFTINL